VLDPLNERIVAGNISGRLSRLRPEHSAYFNDRLKAYQRKLDEHMFGAELVERVGGAELWTLLLKGQLDSVLDASDRLLLGGLAALKPHTGKKVVTYHRSWSYFAHRFSLVVAAELERKPGIPPSPGHVAKVVRRVKGEGIQVLLMKPFYSREAPDFVAAQMEIRVVECANPVGGQPEATDYLAMLDNIVSRVNAHSASERAGARGLSTGGTR
jgi:ABC-type Zn uptake system ZnuABC Zn-binding protein ZnuA